MTAGLGLRSPAFLGALGGAIPLFDDFNRADSTDLGVTSVGGAAWQELVGDWSISSNRIVADATANALAVVDAKTADVDIALNISSGGRDGIVFRATNASNYLRFSFYRNTTTSSTTTCDYTYNFVRDCSGDDLTGDCAGVGCFSGVKTSCGSCPSPCVCCTFDSGCGSTTTVCDEDCTTTTSSSTTRRVYLDRIVDGAVQQVNYWSAGAESLLRVQANGNQVTLWRGGTQIATVTEDFNLDAELHGVGRSTRGNNSNSALDNFDLSPI